MDPNVDVGKLQDEVAQYKKRQTILMSKVEQVSSTFTEEQKKVLQEERDNYQKELKAMKLGNDSINQELTLLKQ
jgi:hypothetical protein